MSLKINKKYALIIGQIKANKMTMIRTQQQHHQPTQEKFKCTECGYETNADENSSANILNRVCIDVLCNRLLKLSDNGEFRPKKTKR